MYLHRDAARRRDHCPFAATSQDPLLWSCPALPQLLNLSQHVSISPGCLPCPLMLCVPGSPCTEVLPADRWKWEKIEKTKDLHRIIALMTLFSFNFWKWVHSWNKHQWLALSFDTDELSPCVLLALFQSFSSNKSSLLKRHFSEDLIQSSGNCYCPQMQGKWRAIPRNAVINLSTFVIGFFFFFSAFKSWNHVNDFMLF